MYKEDSVYDYIINSINNIITNGISYYADKDIDKLNCLMKIYDYINVDVESVIAIDNDSDETEVVEDKIVECTQLDNIMKANDQVAEQVKSLIDNFMSKITDIKINVLNLENDLSLYCDSTACGVIKDIKSSSVVSDENVYAVTDNSLVESGKEVKIDDELLRVSTVKVKDLGIDEDSIEVNDILDMGETIVEENDTSIVEDDTSALLNKSSDLSSEGVLSESENTEKIEDDSIIDLDEEEVSHNIELEESIDDVELEDKPRKHSILDLFRKKNG